MCAKFQLSSMMSSSSRTLCPWSQYLEDVQGSWMESWRMGSSLTLLLSLYVILYMCAKFQLSSMMSSLSRTPFLEVILQGRWRFLTGVLVVWVIFDIVDHLGRPNLSYPESFIKICLDLVEKILCVYKLPSIPVVFHYENKDNSKNCFLCSSFQLIFFTLPLLDKMFSFNWRLF